MGFPCGSAGKESTCNAGDLGLIPGLGRSPGEGKGYPLQYSGLENSMDYIVHGVTKSQTWLWLSLSLFTVRKQIFTKNNKTNISSVRVTYNVRAKINSPYTHVVVEFFRTSRMASVLSLGLHELALRIQNYLTVLCVYTYIYTVNIKHRIFKPNLQSVTSHMLSKFSRQMSASNTESISAWSFQLSLIFEY